MTRKETIEWAEEMVRKIFHKHQPKEFEVIIPKGMYAEIHDGKVIIKKLKQE